MAYERVGSGGVRRGHRWGGVRNEKFLGSSSQGRGSDQHLHLARMICQDGRKFHFEIKHRGGCRGLRRYDQPGNIDCAC